MGRCHSGETGGAEEHEESSPHTVTAAFSGSHLLPRHWGRQSFQSVWWTRARLTDGCNILLWWQLGEMVSASPLFLSPAATTNTLWKLLARTVSSAVASWQLGQQSRTSPLLIPVSQAAIGWVFSPPASLSECSLSSHDPHSSRHLWPLSLAWVTWAYLLNNYLLRSHHRPDTLAGTLKEIVLVCGYECT